jgi:hypothetical protein
MILGGRDDFHRDVIHVCPFVPGDDQGTGTTDNAIIQLSNQLPLRKNV